MCVKRDEAHLAAARQAGSGDVINDVRDPLARLPGHGLWRTMTPAPCKIAPPHNADETYSPQNSAASAKQEYRASAAVNGLARQAGDAP